jgi:O-antigen/teichoic acid export membrane protein
VLSRDIAKSPDQEERSRLFATSFFLKIILIALGVIVVLFLAPLFTTIPGAKILLPIIALVTLFDSFREFAHSLIRGLEKTQWEAGIFILTNIAIVGFGFLFLHLRPTPKSFAYAYAVGTGIGAFAAYIYLWGYIKNAYSHISAKLIKPLLQSAWPFAVSSALGILLTNTDILIISWMKSATDVGLYSAAIRIVQLFYLLPNVLQTSIMPVFARLAGGDEHRFRALFERAIGMVYLAAIPIGLGGFILGKEILTLIFGGGYAPAAGAFGILMLTMLVDFPAVLMAGAIFAHNHQKSLIVVSVIAGVSNVVFDLIFIPRFGIIGSAYATFFAQIIANAYLWRVMKKINYFTILPSLKKIFASSIIVSLAAYIIVMAGANVMFAVLAAGVLYLALLKFLKEPLLDEMRLIFGKKNSPTLAGE